MMNRILTQYAQRSVTTTARRTLFTPQMNTFQTPTPNLFMPIPQPQLQKQFMAQYTPQPTLNAMTFGQQIQKQEFKIIQEEVLEFMNRNKRKPKKANHGARPCSSVSRSKKKLRRHHYPK
jgi:hypothetical protein